MATKRAKPSNIKPKKGFVVNQDNIDEVVAGVKKAIKRSQTPKKPPVSDLPAKDEYSLEVKVNDQIFTCQTDNLEEALGALNIARFKTRTFITIKKGNKVFTRILNVPMAKKVLRNPRATRFFAIGVEKYFKF